MATKRKKRKKNPSVALYRRIALSFVVFTVVLLAIVFYLAFSSATITIFPSEEVVSTSFIVPVAEGQLAGKVFDENFELERTFESTGQKSVETDIAGTVTIHNNYSQSQTLVQITRLLTPDGQLFRMKKQAIIPPGSSVAGIEIYADDPDKVKLPIAKDTRFSIPGLWEGLQDKIYAQNPEELLGNTRKVSVVSDSDISSSQAKLEEDLLSQAKKKFAAGLEDQGENMSVELTQVQLVSVSSNASAGDEAAEFSSKVEARVVGVAFSRDALKELALQRLESELPGDKELSGMDISAFTFQLANYDQLSGTANVQAYLEGQTFLKHTSDLLDKGNLTGKTKKEVVSTLTSSPSIKDVIVDLRPFWLSKVPRLPDHVNILIKRTQQ